MKKYLLLLFLCAPGLSHALGGHDGGVGVIPADRIQGTQTNNSAGSGFVGEYISSAPVSQSVGTSGQFSNVATITLTPGDWDVRGSINVVNNGASVTALQGAISINTGNTTTDHTAGINQLDSFLPTVALNGMIAFPPYRILVNSSTPVYLKVKPTYTVATPTCTCQLSARRAR